MILRAVKKPVLVPLGKIAIALFHALALFQYINFEIREISSIDKLISPITNFSLDFSIVRNYDYVKYRYFDSTEKFRFYNVYNKHCQLFLVIKPIRFKNISLAYLVDVIRNQLEPVDFLLVARALRHIGKTTGAYVCVMDVPESRLNRKSLFGIGFVPSKSVGYYIMRQNKWDFLKPDNTAFNLDKWEVFPGDGDNL
jgi:hypothetical protein